MLKASDCPRVEILWQLLLGQLAEAEVNTLNDHLASCPRCEALLIEFRDLPTITPPTSRKQQELEPATLPNIGPRMAAPPHENVLDENTLVPENKGSSSTFSFLSPPRQDDELGRLGTYRILKLLGEGGMGLVFQAEDPSLKRLVALKVMRPEASSNPGARQRFMQEGQLAAALQHDNIVGIFQVGESNGVPFLAMPFLQGAPLDDRLKREGPLPIPELLRIARETATGLAAAHERQPPLIHRDIKPANIWLERVDEARPARVKILDFGLARELSDNTPGLTKSGMVMGTPDYMAPEQARSLPLDPRCDLFSLGCVIYHMCTGRKPFQADDVMATLIAVTTEEPLPVRQINPNVPPHLDRLVQSLMSKHPNDRPKSARAVLDDLIFIERALSEPTPDTSSFDPQVRSVPSATSRKARQSSSRRRDPYPPPPPKPDIREAPTQPASGSKQAGRLEELGLSASESLVMQTPAPVDRPAAPVQQPNLGGKTSVELFTPSTILPSAATVTETLCPQCGSTRFSASMKWCMACGYTTTQQAAAPGMSRRQLRLQAFSILLVTGFVILIAGSFFCDHYLDPGSEAWKRWVWWQAIAGLASMALALIWTYRIIKPYHDSSRSLVPLHFSPGDFLKLTYYYLPDRTCHSVCFGMWGALALVIVLFIVGDPLFFLSRRGPINISPSMNVSVRSDVKVLMTKHMKTSNDASKEPKLRCSIIGVRRNEKQAIDGIALAEEKDGKLRYIGTATELDASLSNEELASKLDTVQFQSSPPKDVGNLDSLLIIQYRWIKPRIVCNVKGSRTGNVMENIVIIGF